MLQSYFNPLVTHICGTHLKASISDMFRAPPSDTYPVFKDIYWEIVCLANEKINLECLTSNSYILTKSIP